MQIRPARLADLDAIMEIQAACYTAIVPESATSMGAKLAASPDTCRVALAPDGGLLGYLLALPWTAARPPLLDAEACVLPTAPDTLYLHDLAMAPRARGMGVGQALAHQLLALADARGLPAHLIAIQNSQSFWARLGFVPAPLTSDLQTKLASYGAEACYMTRPRPHR